MKDRHPQRGQEQRVPGRAHPGRRARARPRRPRGLVERRRRAGGSSIAGRRVRGGRARRSLADRRRGLGQRRPAAQGQGADRRGVPPAAQGPGAVHLPAPRRRPSAAPTRCSTSGTTAIAYETVQLPDGSLPLLAPMSEVAGRLAPQVGAYHLMRPRAARGVLLGGVPGVHAGEGRRASAAASPGRTPPRSPLGHGRRRHRARHERRRSCASSTRRYDGRVRTVASNAYEIERRCWTPTS